MIHLGDMVADRIDLLARFSATFGQDVWVHRTNGWTLIGLDAASFGKEAVNGLQTAWLRETLQGCDGPIGLFLHEPWFGDSAGREVPPAMRHHLEALFDGHDLCFVVKGYTHQIQPHPADDIGTGWVPAIGFAVPAAVEGDSRLVGLARLTLDRDGHRFDYVEVPGMPRLDPAEYVTAFAAPARRELAAA
ncbi:MAG: hypothetical protein WC729_22625 [Sphingomonas sp.]|jgi:hypothetical protein|uniref:hypothetical protein n=1 Tax=Sphingomonas sp. TaxID=28214 RepID=UPI003564EB4E